MPRLPDSNIFADAYQVAEVQLPAGSGGTAQQGQTFNFPDLPYLRPLMAYIQAIEIYTLASVTNSPISGTPLASLAITQRSSVTFYGGVAGVKQGNQIIQQMPLVRLNNLQNQTPDPFAQNVLILQDMQVDWTKSFVTVNPVPGNTTNMVFLFGIYFNFNPSSGNMNSFANNG